MFGMQNIDTGKINLSLEENRYVLAVIYTNDEIEKEDVKSVTDYLDQFKEPIPILIERTGHYSISVMVQIVMLQQTKNRLKAAAFVERNNRDALMTRIAASTYFKDIEVKSFFKREDAVAWLMKNYATEPLLADS
ncbi:MAG: STAS/SEC14 domain-containing protein [Candidatus Thiodiazotropha taylori]|nr:STAS/SEC14 domain-containing protein [Candidatus Thiodiazotropha taylori]